MKHITYLLLCLFLTFQTSAQVGINTDNSDPDASAILDIKSTNKGMLVPRMTSSQRTMIINAAIGLLVFDTDTESFWFKDSTGWMELVNGNATTLADADNDTKIQTEENADEDVIRFDIAGEEGMVLKRANPANKTQLSFPNNLGDIFIGEGVGQSLEENSASTAVGYKSFRLNEFGSLNAAFGALALEKNVNGSWNTALGTEALRASKGDKNTGVGSESLHENTTGSNNVGVGYNVGNGNQEGNNNVLVGNAAGGKSATHNKSNNVMIGHESGLNTIGSGNLFLGYNAGKNETGSNKLYIENSNSAAPLLYGEFDADLLRINGTLNINNAFSFPINDGTSGQVLTTDGSGTATWTTLPDSTSAFSRNASSKLILPNNSIVDFTNDDFVFGSTQLDDSGDANHDSRFFFDKSKGAFRAGIEEGDKWNDANRGVGSVAIGNGNTAAGENSVAMGYQSGAMSIGAVGIGYQNGALGDVAVAIGNRNVVDTDTAYAIGSYNFADKDYALAVGTENEAKEEGSTAIGYANLATGIGASAFGEFNEANGESSLALGSGAIANGNVSVAIGSSNAEGMGSLAVGIGNTASGDFSQTFGSSITAPSAYETVFGYFNTAYTPTSTSNPSLTDRLFVIGNGIGPLSNQRSDALIILKNGSTRINGPLTLGISGNDLTSYTLPNVRGSNGQILQMNGSGVASWAAIPTGSSIANSSGTTKVDASSSSLISFEVGGQEIFSMQRGNINFLNSSGSIYLGDEAGKSDNFTGLGNIGIGANALAANSTGSNNTAIGNSANAGSGNLTNATALGASATVNQSNALVLGNNADVGIGTSTPDEKLHVVGNVKIEDGDLTISGERLAFNNTYDNIFIGDGAGFNNVDDGNGLNDNGRENYFIGDSTGYNNTIGRFNLGLAAKALYNNTIGTDNIALGAFSLLQNTEGTFNVGIGLNSLSSNIDGHGNTALGYRAGAMNERGNSNVFIGSVTGGSFNASQTADMANNVMLGFAAGGNNTGSNNVFLGHKAGFDETGDNKLYIDNSETTTPLIYGEFDNDLVRVNGELNIKNEYSLPSTDGTNGQVLTTDGGGNASWANNSGVPVGTIMMWATSTPPTGWVICNGQSITAYPQLVAILGSNNAPNLEDRFPYGAGPFRSLGQSGGRESVALTEANIPQHSHDAGTLKTTYNYKSNNSSAGSANNRDGSDVRFYDGNDITGNTGIWGGAANGLTQSFEIIPPFLALNFIIKVE